MDGFNMDDNSVLDRLSRKEAVAEALLFAAGSPVREDELALVLKIRTEEVAGVIDRLSAFYAAHNSGLLIKHIHDSYQLASRPEFRDDLKPHFEQVTSSPLSRSALEALTIIAYNQPITRGGVEIIRGVNSDSVISTLLERGLICEVGRSESPGRPMLYGTTDLFLKSAGITDIDELLKMANDNGQMAN
ncbi:MAG: SMC-Scp complex subunit ScpB [Clostridia bacterium]|nr:SMC-Scp complex subunit ScpB [Clostridia bacterium]